MKVSVCLVAVAILFLVNSVQERQAQASVWGQVVGVLLLKIGNLYESFQFELFGRICHYQVKPSFAKFQLTYKGKAFCAQWPTLEGTSRRKSRKGAMENAIAELVEKIRANKLVTETEASKYVNKPHAGSISKL